MSNAIIRSFFDTAIAAWAPVQSSTVAVAYADVPFTPPALGSYVELFLMPAVTLTATVKANRFREIGIFQVNLYTRAGTGTGLQDTLIQSLISAFPVTPKGVVSIESQPYATQLHQEVNGFKVVAITVPYRYES